MAVPASRPPSPEEPALSAAKGRGGQGLRTPRRGGTWVRLRRRRATTGLVTIGGFLRPERTDHVARAHPRTHQLLVVPEPIPHQPVEHPHLLRDLAEHGLKIGGRTHMTEPCRTRGL